MVLLYVESKEYPVHGHRAGAKCTEWIEWTETKKPMALGTIGHDIGICANYTEVFSIGL